MTRHASDCEDCGQTIEFGDAEGFVQPDAEVSCDGCGAVHQIEVDDDSTWLVIVKRGGEVIDELRHHAAMRKREVAALHAELALGARAAISDIIRLARTEKVMLGCTWCEAWGFASRDELKEHAASCPAHPGVQRAEAAEAAAGRWREVIGRVQSAVHHNHHELAAGEAPFSECPRCIVLDALASPANKEPTDGT